ncbi:MAG TPA: hypothetical protein VF746_12295 [Longimicrobium sp.]
MATLAVGTRVRLVELAVRSLAHLPPREAELRVSVHPAALNARQNRHTQVAGLVDGAVVWLGALGEDLLLADGGPADAAVRRAVRGCILAGPRLWEIARPGPLSRDDRPLSTVYHGERPWLVIGETPDGGPVAVPLNRATNPKWYSPEVPQASMSFPGNDRSSQVELAHAWTLSAAVPACGTLSIARSPGLKEKIRAYFDFGA